ncbi:rCG57154, isoform CRA_a [Rattus norvegicus]|uniref:Cytochrome c oxidase subunit 7B, mitochondrial n=2 Tax=Rattus norvegicus TaxID=10116 RepID=A0A0G2K6P0_RAT|nr:cytochrome c oxidase subunit 7B2 [Rattus norvegicus]XP_038948650.1 cytochrome c oxidase subunit 7B2 isoform X1 [Rattus norvegicus]XP_038948651.1 cytochrome c oxidase subunit 7B2 isoform X1 [Rattus norvegicus]XP_038948652.1 cytochrome c oxidase subunit 7B2 isoform X1 [Rattus norvegicus]EDL90006.1 rCG57154, isoform CRA_a [Rattus norvegicus]EDL90007.1 rCG57154, isoform CRA_a [Rattus norvegicus]|eukprot:XP_006250994.1 PREDICTED: cytochrome c oxidase subunit 7B, mitochondrial [Rattus norvegicus]
MMLPLARCALNHLKIQSIPKVVGRQKHSKPSSNFHDKYGNMMLFSGSAFCLGAYIIFMTQMGVEWNLSPVGRVTPKEWNE